MEIAEVCLHTNDVLRLANFYKMLFSIQNDSDDSVHQFIITNGTTLTIYNDGSLKNNFNQNISLSFTVENVDKEYIRLKKLCVPIIEAPTTRPWGARNMHFTDPDGNHIYFRSFEKVD